MPRRRLAVTGLVLAAVAAAVVVLAVARSGPDPVRPGDVLDALAADAGADIGATFTALDCTAAGTARSGDVAADDELGDGGRWDCELTQTGGLTYPVTVTADAPDDGSGRRFTYHYTRTAPLSVAELDREGLLVDVPAPDVLTDIAAASPDAAADALADLATTYEDDTKTWFGVFGAWRVALGPDVPIDQLGFVDAGPGSVSLLMVPAPAPDPGEDAAWAFAFAVRTGTGCAARVTVGYPPATGTAAGDPAALDALDDCHAVAALDAAGLDDWVPAEVRELARR